MIKEVVLRRFKQFENTPFSLSGHVVLAGQNNSGKTTVLQALSAWSLACEQLRSPQPNPLTSVRPSRNRWNTGG